MNSLSIVAVVGSLRKDSYNRQLAVLAKAAVGDRAAFELLEYEDVPLLNQDIEYPAPEPVARVRKTIGTADGVWFFTPEYNHFFPGVLKNLIDWLSRPVEGTKRRVLSRKPVAISGVTPGMSGTGIAQDHLVSLLSTLNMRVMNIPRLTIPNAEDQTDTNGHLALTASAPYLQKQADAFLRFLEKEKTFANAFLPQKDGTT
jgi:chromate reductase